MGQQRPQRRKNHGLNHAGLASSRSTEKFYVALTTKQTGKYTSRGEANKSGDYLSIKAWRMTKTSDSIEKDGKTWHWCPHQVDGIYDGLYVTHRPEEHEDWKKNKFQFRREKIQKDKKKKMKLRSHQTNHS